MKAGGGHVARGSVGDAIISFPVYPRDTPDDSTLEPAPIPLPLPGVEAVQNIHTLTDQEVSDLVKKYDQRGSYSVGERMMCVRRPQNEIRRFITDSGQQSSLIAPTMSEERQPRLVVLESGPRASVELRLRKPLANGTTKVQVDLLPGDEIEVGIYTMAENNVEEIAFGQPVVHVNARDVNRVIRCRELDKVLADDTKKEESACQP